MFKTANFVSGGGPNSLVFGYYNNYTNGSIGPNGPFGVTNQSINAVAIGNNAGQYSQGTNALALGNNAGYSGQGSGSICIGAFAGQTSAPNNTIILNALGSAMTTQPSNAGAFYVSSIRTDPSQTMALTYNTQTCEIAYTAFQSNGITAVSSNTFTGNNTFTNSTAFTAATVSTTTSTGAVIIPNGGLGVGGTINANAAKFFSGTDATSTSTGSIIVSGGIGVSGNVYASKFYATSDRRFKENIEPISAVLDRVLALNPAQFQWKKNGQQDYGFIAQEVYKIFPEMSPLGPDAGENPVDICNNPIYYSIDYDKIVCLLTKAIQEMNSSSLKHSAWASCGYSVLGGQTFGGVITSHLADPVPGPVDVFTYDYSVFGNTLFLRFLYVGLAGTSGMGSSYLYSLPLPFSVADSVIGGCGVSGETFVSGAFTGKYLGRASVACNGMTSQSAFVYAVDRTRLGLFIVNDGGGEFVMKAHSPAVFPLGVGRRVSVEFECSFSFEII